MKKDIQSHMKEMKKLLNLVMIGSSSYSGELNRFVS